MPLNRPPAAWRGRPIDVAPAEDRRVPALRQVDQDLVVLAFFLVVPLEPGAEPPRLDAHDGIRARVEGCLASEHLNADGVFLEVVALARERLARDEGDEVFQPIRRPERGARRDALDLIANLALRAASQAAVLAAAFMVRRSSIPAVSAGVLRCRPPYHYRNSIVNASTGLLRSTRI